MTVAKTTIYNVQTDGNDLNGGGFNSARGGTNYSLQASAQLSLSDCTTSGAGVTTLTSATGGFTAAMVGNIIHLTSGTNLLTNVGSSNTGRDGGFFEITAYTDTNTVTLDRAPDDGVGGISSVVGKVGGAMASLGWMTGATDDDIAEGVTVYVKSGTYTISCSSLADTTGTQVYINKNNPFNSTFEVAGYYQTQGDLDNTVGSSHRPLFQKGTTTGVSYIMQAYTNYNTMIVLRHLVVDAGGLNGIYSFWQYHDITLRNTSYHGFLNGIMASCCTHAGPGQFGFAGMSVMYGCIASGCTNTGFSVHGKDSVHCIAAGCGKGFTLTASLSTAINCTAHGNTGNGFELNGGTSNVAINCHSEANGDYGYKLLEDVDDGSSLINCSDFGNTNGRKQYNDNSTYNTYDINPISLSVSGVTSTTDFTPNPSGGGGELLRGSGMMFNNHAKFLDIGAVTHTPASGGGGGNTYHPLANPNHPLSQ